MRLPAHRGVSLAEAIVACFILTAAMAVSAALYHTALNHSVRIDRMHRASRAVEKRIEKIRAWSRDVHGTNGKLYFNEGWGPQGDSESDTEYPEIVVKARIIDKDLYSPSSAFEEVRFAALADETVSDDNKDKKRTLGPSGESTKLIEVTGTWGTGPKDRLVARFLLADPVKDYGWEPKDAPKAIVLSSVPVVLAKNGKVNITATIQDKNGSPVKNAVVQWYIDPASEGKATLETDPRYPDRVTLTNVVRVDSNPSSPGPELSTWQGGWVRVVARVRLGGIEAINKTPGITLAQ